MGAEKARQLRYSAALRKSTGSPKTLKRSFRSATLPKILVVDDDPTILILVEHALEKAGYQVVTCEDPTRVATLAARHGVDAVVLDVMMPGVSGYEVLRSIREAPRVAGVPILFLSAKADSQDRVRGLREGADDYLIKPFEPEELVLRIERLVARRPEAGVGDPARLERSLVDRQVVGQLYLGRYKALEVVGEGAMGMVFRGWDPLLKRPVALKTLRFDRLAGAENRGDLVSQLLQEAVTVARFSHPHIVGVFDVGKGEDTAFIAMEYVDGVSLADFLQDRGALPPEHVVDLGLGIARGLGAAHGHNILHHDVKPGNVLLGFDGSIKVTDFGVAQLGTSLARRQEKIFGTPGYLPAETLTKKGYTVRGDLFGLGAVLYLALTGHHAIPGKKLHEVVMATIDGKVVPPGDRVEGIPESLSVLLLDLLARDPALRIGSASEVVARLEAMATAEPSWEPPGGPLESVRDLSTDRSMMVPPVDATIPLDSIE